MSALRKFWSTFFIFRAKLLNPFWEVWYRYVSKRDKGAEVTFLNYGYADNDKLELGKEDENNRYFIKLYNHIADSIRLEGLDVLEVGCGRGGGASYIARYLKPKSVKAIDLCKRSVTFCKSYYDIKGLSFYSGNALSLPFMDNSFDAVINVESSHRYSDMERFLGEVYRVLKPGGYFLFADLRDEELIESLRKQLDSCQLRVVKEEIITPNVIKALTLTSKQKADLIERLVPRFFHGLTKEFAGIKETVMYNSFMNRKKEYLHYIMQKG